MPAVTVVVLAQGRVPGQVLSLQVQPIASGAGREGGRAGLTCHLSPGEAAGC